MRPKRFAEVVTIVLKLAPSLVLLVVIGGCQDHASTVFGVITIDGRPFTIPADARGTVVFQPDGGHGTMATALLDATGHFNLATGSSPEVAQGKYYVTVSVAQLLPKVENEEQGAKLITPAKYSSPRDSGLVIDVKPGVNQVTLDLLSGTDEGKANAPDSTTDASHSDESSLPKSATENK